MSDHDGPRDPRSSAIGGGGRSAAATADESHQVVYQFIKDVQPRSIKSKQKKHITAFAKWYFQKKPALNDSDLTYLMLGESEKKGLLETCGNSNMKKIFDIKRSSILALELVVMLLDATINIHSEKFLDFLPRVPLKIIQSMKLERHVLNDASEPDNAFKLLFMLQEQMPNTPVSAYLDNNSDAMKAYEEWYHDHLEEKEDEEEDEGPRNWAAVKLEDLDREEAQGMEVDIENMMLDAAAAAADDEGETLDPLGLTRISLNARGDILVGKNKVGASKGASSSKKMKLFWKKLLAQKEMALKKKGGAVGEKKETNGSIEEEEDEEEEEGGGIHLMDAIIQKGSINTSQPDFNPVLFLNTVHTTTSLSQLQKGLDTLEQNLSDRNAQMKKLVEQHFGQYVYCKATIDHLHSLLQSELSSNTKIASSSGRSVRLLKDIESVRDDCQVLYAPLIERKTETDQIHSVLNILQRFKFLFSLPKKLTEKKGGWEQVIRDYQKAKQIVVIKANAAPAGANNPSGTAANATPPSATSPSSSSLHNLPSSASSASSASASLAAAAAAAGAAAAGAPSAPIVPTAANSVSLQSLMNPTNAAAAEQALTSGTLGIPESVLFEIGSIVRSLRGELFRQLDQSSIPLDEQQKVIETLIALDCEEDPAWYYLQKQRESIAALMEKSMEELCARLETSLVGTQKLKEFTVNANSPYSNKSPLRLLHGSVPLSTLVLHNGESVAALSKFIRKLCVIVLKSLPDFFELATAIENGKFGNWQPPEQLPAAGGSALQTVAGHRGSVFDESGKPAASSNATSSASPTTPLPSSTPSLASAVSVGASSGVTSTSPPVVEKHSVGKLIAQINNQFVGYLRLVLFPAKDGASSTSSTNTTSTGSTKNRINALPSPTSPSFDDPERAFFSFPPNMSQHTHDVLSVIDHIRALPTMPQEYTTDLRVLADQLTALYLDHHVSELLTSVAQLSKDESWEIDSGKIIGNENDIEFGLGGNTPASILSLPSMGESAYSDPNLILNESSSEIAGNHGHAGTAATNASFQITLLPSQFLYLIRGAFESFSAIPSIKSKWVVERMAGAVFESMKLFADGLHSLAVNIRATLDAIGYGDQNQLVNQSAVSNGNAIPASLQPYSPLSNANSSIVSQWVKPQELDRRLLLIWSNVMYVSDELLGPLFDELLSLLPLSTHTILEQKFSDEIIHLYNEVLENQILVASYTKSKVMNINHILKKGFFKNGFNWRSKNTVMPGMNANGTTSTSSGKSSSSSTRSSLSSRSCVLELVLQLVLIHDELYTVRKDELDRLMEGIIDKLALSCLSIAHQLESICDINGANQLLMELEFIEGTIDYYLTDESTQTFDNAKALLQQRIDDEADEFANGGTKTAHIIQQAAADRTALLSQLKQSTSLMASCFTSVQMRKKREEKEKIAEEKR